MWWSTLECDVYRLQIPTSKIGVRAERVKYFLFIRMRCSHFLAEDDKWSSIQWAFQFSGISSWTREVPDPVQINHRFSSMVTHYKTDLKSQRAVTADMKNKQLLPFWPYAEEVCSAEIPVRSLKVCSAMWINKSRCFNNINHVNRSFFLVWNEQRCLSPLFTSPSFEYLYYGSTAIHNVSIISLRGPSWDIRFRLWRLKTVTALKRVIMLRPMRWNI